MGNHTFFTVIKPVQQESVMVWILKSRQPQHSYTVCAGGGGGGGSLSRNELSVVFTAGGLNACKQAINHKCHLVNRCNLTCRTRDECSSIDAKSKHLSAEAVVLRVRTQGASQRGSAGGGKSTSGSEGRCRG